MSGAVMPFTFAGGRGAWTRKMAAGLLLAAALVLTAGTPAEARRYASIVIDAGTGEVLHADKADRRAYPASLTKMMTLYLLFEAVDQGRLGLNQKLPVSRRAAGMPPSKLGLKRGQSIRVKDAIKALVTKSANDVAVVVAEALGGSEQKFARLMTEKARTLGMTRTTFRNASGLPNNRQLSTARDMARLARALQRRYPHHYAVFKTKAFSYKGRRYKNHNKLLSNYAGTDGIKTGYTHASGFNLAASTVRDGRRLIAVVFGGKTAKSRDRHMRKLLDRSFAKLAKRGVPLVSTLPTRKPQLDAGGAPAKTETAEGTELDRIIEQVASKGQAARAALPVTPQPKPALDDPKPAVRAAAASRDAASEGAPKEASEAAEPQQTASAEPPAAPTPRAKPADPAPAETKTGATPAPAPQVAETRSTGTQGASKIASLSRLAKLSGESQGSTEGLPRGVGRLGTLRVVRNAGGGDPAVVSWAVQVGAFTRYETAQHAASKAISKMPTFLRSSQVMISSSPGVSGPIFRARVVGMTESSARLACGALKAKSMNCVVVPPGQG